jgi:hypothetical protein
MEESECLENVMLGYLQISSIQYNWLLCLSDKNVVTVMPVENQNLIAAVCEHGPENQQFNTSDLTNSGQAGNVCIAGKGDGPGGDDEDSQCTQSADSTGLPQGRTLDSTLDSSAHRDESKENNCYFTTDTWKYILSAN